MKRPTALHPTERHIYDRILLGSPGRLWAALFGAVFGWWAPIAAAIGVIGFSSLDGTAPMDAPTALSKALSAVVFVPFAAVPIMMAAFVGHLVLVGATRRGATSYALPGFVVGAGCALMLVLDDCSRYEMDALACMSWGWTTVTFLGAIPGACGAVVFWLIARPDKHPVS